MIGYVMVGTNNLDASIKFYDEILGIIGLERVETIEDDYAAYAQKGTKNIEFYIDTDETEYFPLPTELRTNIKNLSNFISSMFPENTIKSENGIKNDKSWSATKALASL
mgnify:CR=1 FL=1